MRRSLIVALHFSILNTASSRLLTQASAPRGAARATLCRHSTGRLPTAAARRTLCRGTGAAALLGGAGSDSVLNMVDNPTVKIDCGSAYDPATAYGATDVRRYEIVV